MGGSSSSGGGNLSFGSRTASSFGRMRDRSGTARQVRDRARANYQRRDAFLNRTQGAGAAAAARAERRRRRPRER